MFTQPTSAYGELNYQGLLASTVAGLDPHSQKMTSDVGLQLWPSNTWFVNLPQEKFNEQTYFEHLILPQRLLNPLYGREDLNHLLQEMAYSASPIEQVWEITKKFPSLSKLLSGERDNE